MSFAPVLVEVISAQPRQVVRRGEGPVQVRNRDEITTVYLGPEGVDPSSQAVAILDPLGSQSFSGKEDVWAKTAAGTAIVNSIPTGLSGEVSPAQIAAQIALTRLQIQLTGLGAVVPSGDQSGITDTQAILNASSSSPNGTVILADGNFYVLASQLKFGIGSAPRPQALVHLGDKSTCRIYQVGAAGWTIWAHNDTSTYQQNSWVTFAGFTIDLTLAAAGAAGFDIGDIGQIYLDDVDVHAGGQAGTINYLIVNRYFFTEQIHGTIHSSNAAQHVVFDCIPALATGSQATGSFERMALTCWVSAPSPTQNIVVFQDGAFCGDGELTVLGNCGAAATGTPGSTLTVTGQAPATAASASVSNLSHMRLHLGLENPGGAVTPVTITFGGLAGNNILDCWGELDWSLNPAGTFAGAVNPSGRLDFKGQVKGDDTLISTVANPDWVSVTTGLPAGWTGQARFRMRQESGLVTVRIELNIASATVITQGETLLTTLPAKFVPASNEPITAVLFDPSGTPANTPCVVSITTGGQLQANQAHTMGQAGSLVVTRTYPNSI